MKRNESGTAANKNFFHNSYSGFGNQIITIWKMIIKVWNAKMNIFLVWKATDKCENKKNKPTEIQKIEQKAFAIFLTLSPLLIAARKDWARWKACTVIIDQTRK